MPDKTIDQSSESNISTSDLPIITSPTPKKTRKPRQPKSAKPIVSNTTNAPKTLNTKDWLESTSDINKYSQFLIDKEKDIHVNYNEIFSEVKIEKLLTELYNHINYNQVNKIGYFNNDEEFIVYLNFLIIKYFTDMSDLLSDSLELNIVVINKLREDRKFKVFFEEIFDNEQVMRVYETMNKLTEMLAKLDNMKESQLEEIIKSVQTPFLKDNYSNQLETLKQSKIN